MNQMVSVMRRMAGDGRPPPEFGRMSAGRALRLALAQASQELAALDAVPGAAQDERTSVARLEERVGENALFMLLQGPNDGLGLAVVDPAMLAALVEIQTTGRVSPRPVEPRHPTLTDAVLCAPVVNRTIELMAQQMEAVGEAERFAGYRYVIALESPRAIAMTLPDIPYRLLNVPTEFGGGAKSGRLLLVLPFEPPRPVQSIGGAVSGRASGFTDQLRAQVMETHAQLSATLFRIEMPLAQATALKPGAVLHIPRSALERVVLEDLEGRRVATGRLGQINGNRALRLNKEDASPQAQPAAQGLSLPLQGAPRPEVSLAGHQP